MTTGKELLSTLCSELKDLGLPQMSSKLETLYRTKRFLEIDHMTFLAELIEVEYQDKVSKRINNRLRNAHLIGSPQELSKCVDSQLREYFPSGVTTVLSSLDFIKDGLNACILGSSDSGKSYLAKAIGVRACQFYRVAYHHSESLFEELVALKSADYKKYQSRIKRLTKLDLLILDDFLLHTITDEREIKVLFEIMEKRSELAQSTIVCSQREPSSWASMILNDEVASNSIMKRATKHYTIVINSKETE